jgi:hypothetical protein
MKKIWLRFFKSEQKVGQMLEEFEMDYVAENDLRELNVKRWRQRTYNGEEMTCRKICQGS